MYAILVEESSGWVIDWCIDFEKYIDGANEVVIHYDNDKGNPIAGMNKPRWNFDTEEWEETEPIEPPQIDNCPPKTLEQRLEEAEQKLVETEQRLTESEEEKKLLKAQVEANTSTQEFLESCLMEIAEVVYA